MKIRVTRDSVAAGDDMDAPHTKIISLSDSAAVEDMISAICASGYLATIQGGKATWSVVSGFPIAVVAQQWQNPRFLPCQPLDTSKLQFKDGVVGIHFNYHAQQDPDVVFEVLKRCRLDVF